MKLKFTEGPQGLDGPRGFSEARPGGSATGYLSPKIDYVIPPGCYQVAVVNRYRPPGQKHWIEIESNRITKTFP